jgi:hypothetical protein
MYFQNFPYTYYSLNEGANVKVITNITLRAQVSDQIKANFVLFDEYDVKDGETPEIVADKFYNNSLYHWIILHVNDIIDPRFDWVMTTNNLVKFCEDKYTNIYGTHHYENAEGYWVNSDASGATPISNFQYEDRLNEEKRRIKILKPIYVEAVVSDFNKTLRL